MTSAKSIFVFLVAVISLSSGNFTNGAAPLYFRMDPKTPLSDRFEIIRNTDFVRNLTAARKMTRTAKLENLEQWMRGYMVDKYDLINMYDRMLTIQNRAKYIMKFYSNRVGILQIELMRSNLTHIVGKQNKMNYVTSFNYSKFSDNYFKPAFFYFDIDWEQDYKYNTYLPAHQVFIDYYFPAHVREAFNNTSLTVEQRITSINYTLLGFGDVTNDEGVSLKQYYRYYLTKSNETLLECTE